MNNVSLVGNLTRDVELRYVGENKTPITTLGLAVNNNRSKKEETLFVDVDVWGKQAELCSEYLAKGRSIGVTGRLKQDLWEDKDTGKKRSKIIVVADNVQFLGKGGNAVQEQEEPVGAVAGEETPF